MTGVTILATNVVTTSCPIINVVFSVLGITLVIGFLLFLSGFIFDNDEIGLTGELYLFLPPYLFWLVFLLTMQQKFLIIIPMK